jgi:hypothetical protein
VRKAGRNWTDSDDDDDNNRSRRSDRGSSRRDSDVDELRAAVMMLSKKVSELADAKK